MRVAIVVGHHAQSRGATATSGAQEYDLNLILARQIVAGLQGGTLGRVFEHVPAKDASVVLAGTVKRVNTFAPDAVVELHWNAAVGANGERSTRYWTASHAVAWHLSPRGQDLGSTLAEACAMVLGTVDWGYVVRTSGYPMLRDTSAPSVLLETHNGLDERSHRRFLDAVADGTLGRALGAAVSQWVK